MTTDANDPSNAVVLIDLDGVIVDLHGYAYDLGRLQHEACRWNMEGCCLPGAVTHDHLFNETELFLNAPPIDGALYGVVKLKKAGFDVRFVSTPWMSNPDSASAKVRWMQLFLGSWGVERLILTHDKTMIPGWVLIDDKPGLTGPWHHIEYPQAWNNSITPTWKEGLADRLMDCWKLGSWR